ncbi:hypothetical protein [Paenibacillus sp. FSL R7-0333]|uniref:hypothetical protein n=1 Tax=Paenibacillus sp. FSL R7-0333 TaxID=1926587 RepID=UPI00096F987B|nr:hypothetical protein BK146_24600 [Paenibacillus sp. FSL R7-0333]
MNKKNPKIIKLDEMETASKYIRKKYSIGFWGLGILKLGDINKLRSDLVKDHTESEIISIKASIDTQFEHYKQLTSIITILALIFTMIFTSINTQINFTMKPMDWIYNANQELNKDLNKNMKPDERTGNLIKQTNEMAAEYFKVTKAAFNALQMNIYFIAIFLILIIYTYFGRFRWIVLVKNILEEALKEKKREKDEDERKGKNRNNLRMQRLMK